MFNKLTKVRLLSSGTAVATVSLSLLMGVQIAAYADGPSACAVGDVIANACSSSYRDPTNNSIVVTISVVCVERNCSSLYENNNPAEVSCDWCAEH